MTNHASVTVLLTARNEEANIEKYLEFLVPSERVTVLHSHSRYRAAVRPRTICRLHPKEGITDLLLPAFARLNRQCYVHPTRQRRTNRPSHEHI